MSDLNVTKVQVYDPETGAPLMVPEGQIPALAAQGKVTFQKGQNIPVQDSGGVVGTVPAEQAQQAFQQGYSVEPYEARAQDAIRTQYGDTSGEVKASLAGLARGVSLGTSDLALTKMGVVSPETLEYLKKANPGISLTSEIAGAAAPAVLSGGESALGELAAATPAGLATRAGEAATERIAEGLGSTATKTLAQKIAQTAISKGAGSAIEGSLYSAGNVLSEASLGDPDANAHHALAEIGMGSLLVGLFGVGMEGASSGLKKLIGKRVSAEAAETALRDQIGQDAATSANIEPVSTDTEASSPSSTLPETAAPDVAAPTASSQAFDARAQQAPGSLQDVVDRVNAAKTAGESVEMPQKAIVLDAEKYLAPELKYPMTEAQVQALNDPKTYDLVRAVKESNTVEGKALTEYEGLQKKESTDLLHATIDNVAPGAKVTADPVEGGNRVVSGFTDQYESDQKALGKAFKTFDEIAPNAKVGADDIIKSISDSLPKFEQYINVSPDLDKIALKPYSSTMPFSKNVYSGIKSVLDAANEEGLSVAEIRNVRKNLESFIDKSSGSAGSDMAVLGGIKRNLMDLMQSKVSEYAPDANLRETFKKYAVNEQNREIIEKLFGGSLSDRAGLLKQIAPEKVGDRIFRDTVAVKAARQILSPEAFNEARANYLAEQVAKFTDKNSFRSQPFASWVKTNRSELMEAFADKPEVMRKLQALADRMRILPDAPPINPSGTAKTADLLRIIAGVGKAIQHPMGTLGKGLEKGAEWVDNRAKLTQLDEVMAKRSAVAEKETQYGVLKKIENASKNTSAKISDAIESFFSGKKISQLAIPTLALTSDSDDHKTPYHQLIESAPQIQANPSGIVDHMGSETADIRRYAPNVADSISTLGTQAASFLASKAPTNPYVGNTLTPHTHDWKPSQAEVAQFKRYADAVYHPLSILQHLNDGTIGSEEIETLQTVYPKLYQQIGREAVDQMTELKSPLPYKKRVSISKLLGVPYETTMQPDMISFLQSNHLLSQAQEQPSEGMPNNNSSLSQTGLSKLNKAQNAMTETQRVQTRGA